MNGHGAGRGGGGGDDDHGNAQAKLISLGEGDEDNSDGGDSEDDERVGVLLPDEPSPSLTPSSAAVPTSPVPAPPLSPAALSFKEAGEPKESYRSPNARADELEKHARATFLLFDKDGDGHISAAELEAVMASLNMAPRPGQSAAMIKEVTATISSSSLALYWRTLTLALRHRLIKTVTARSS